AADALRAVVRFVSAVMAVSGALLVADAATTLLWQEPLSALLAGREQAALAATVPPPAPPPAPGAPILSEADLAAGAREEARELRPGDAVGRISLPTLDRSHVIVEGTDTDTLRRGPGHYPKTPLPGAGASVGVAGHRTTYGAPFRTVDRLRRGDPIDVAMPYASLRYRVEEVRIVSPRALWVVEPRGYERLVLTACHPLYSAAQRIVVFARLERASPPAARS
ncbi:MAG: class E sortase, partial [Thermoleophilaceae bacterium]